MNEKQQQGYDDYVYYVVIYSPSVQQHCLSCLNCL